MHWQAFSYRSLGAWLQCTDLLPVACSAEMHEATRRLLGVLLRQMDGFATGEQKRVVVLGATNRKQDLDPALLSRFDASIRFQLPSQDCRCAAATAGMHSPSSVHCPCPLRVCLKTRSRRPAPSQAHISKQSPTSAHTLLRSSARLHVKAPPLAASSRAQTQLPAM